MPLFNRRSSLLEVQNQALVKTARERAVRMTNSNASCKVQHRRSANFNASHRLLKSGPGNSKGVNFLGFTFICGRSRRGRFALKRKSRGDRTRTTLQEIKKEMQRRMHQPIPEQGKWLRKS
jgi:hypothetical protein